VSSADTNASATSASSPTAPNFSGKEHILPDLAISHNSSAVRALLAAGVPINSRGDHGATALHWSCWHGFADLVRLLLDQGASLTIEDAQYSGTPTDWFIHGVNSHLESRSDYAEVARHLIAAGATIPAANLPTNNPEVNAVLREHGLIA
jgi:hypothetical protein